MRPPSLPNGLGHRGRSQQRVAAKRAVELDPVRRGFQPAEHQRALRRVIGSLRVEGAEEALDPIAVTRLVEAKRVGGRLLLPLARADLVADSAAPGEGVGDLTE